MTNFDLAPRPVMVDGLLAVPTDIQSITANLTFDGATAAGSDDATIEFVVGPEAGNSIFDLRQTIAAGVAGWRAIPDRPAGHHDSPGRR
jgi:hypothetical protein